MTRPWSPAEIAGAKAMYERHGWPEEWDGAEVDDRARECYLEDARTVLDAAGAAQQAEVEVAEEAESMYFWMRQRDTSKSYSTEDIARFRAQVRGAGEGK